MLRASLRPEIVSVIPNAVDAVGFTPDPSQSCPDKGGEGKWGEKEGRGGGEGRRGAEVDMSSLLPPLSDSGGCQSAGL